MAENTIKINIVPEVSPQPQLPLLSEEEMAIPLTQLLSQRSAKLRRHEFEELPGPQALHRTEELITRHEERRKAPKKRRSGSQRKNGRGLNSFFANQRFPF